MSHCKDCLNFRRKDDLMGYCEASDDKMVEAERNIQDCIAGSFEPKDQSDDIIS